jgi:protein-S-isoprenylcysteine O-methyltransferase Ste14
MILLAGLWIVWCAVHSLLISDRAHLIAERFMGKKTGAYRILYVLFSFITLVPVLYYQFSIPQHIIIKPNIYIILPQIFLLGYGLLMFYLGAKVYDMRFFLGFTQLQNIRSPDQSETLPFHTDGVLSYVRHPWYSGGIAVIWGFGAITDIYLVTRLILTAYFLLGIIHEEKRLVGELGHQYLAYREKVPMLIPRKPRIKNER